MNRKWQCYSAELIGYQTQPFLHSINQQASIYKSVFLFPYWLSFYRHAGISKSHSSFWSSACRGNVETKKISGRKRPNTQSLFEVLFITSLGWSCHDLFHSRPNFSSCHCNSALLFFLGPSLDFFTVRQRFSAFLTHFMILTWWVTHDKQHVRGRSAITCKPKMLIKNTQKELLDEASSWEKFTGLPVQRLTVILTFVKNFCWPFV